MPDETNESNSEQCYRAVFPISKLSSISKYIHIKSLLYITLSLSFRSMDTINSRTSHVIDIHHLNYEGSHKISNLIDRNLVIFSNKFSMDQRWDHPHQKCTNSIINVGLNYKIGQKYNCFTGC